MFADETGRAEPFDVTVDLGKPYVERYEWLRQQIAGHFDGPVTFANIKLKKSDPGYVVLYRRL